MALPWFLGLRRSLLTLLGAATRLASGDYAARARLAPGDALLPVAERLNEAAAQAERTIAALSEERSQAAAILERIVEAVVAVDAQGRVVAANPAVRAVFGPEAAALGRPFNETLRHPRLEDLLASVLKEGRSRVEELTLFTPAEAHFEAHAVPLREGGAMLVMHDITRLRELEALRREFVANVSHELRTPLASIRGMAETLRDGALEDEAHRREFVEAIHADAQRLSELVEDLLDLSSIESGHRGLEKRAVDLAALAREVAQALKPLAAKRGVSVNVEAGPLGPVEGDEGRLKQVLTNLVANAIKFNKDGGRVDIRVDGGFVSVRDTGVGIAPEDLPRVFERFYRVDPARSRDVGGTGLGLSIVKHIVEAHGGSISVSSRPDEGSTFSFTLPS